MIGLSCAWRAAQSGASVAVIDRATPPAGATRVAAGMLAPVGELTFGEPELLQMTLAAAELYPEFAAELEAASGVATGFTRIGALHVALDRDEAAELRRVHDLQRRLGLDAEWLTTRGCRQLEPGLTPSFAGGVLAAGEAAVDPRALTAALLTAIDREGVELRIGDVEDSLFDGERVVGIRTSAGEELAADSVLLANGAVRAAASGFPRPPARRSARSRARSSSSARAETSRRRASGSSPPSASIWSRARTAA